MIFNCTAEHLFLETAVNVGYSCHLLMEAMDEIFVVAGHTKREVQEELRWKIVLNNYLVVANAP